MYWLDILVPDDINRAIFTRMKDIDRAAICSVSVQWCHYSIDASRALSQMPYLYDINATYVYIPKDIRLAVFQDYHLVVRLQSWLKKIDHVPSAVPCIDIALKCDNINVFKLWYKRQKINKLQSCVCAEIIHYILSLHEYTDDELKITINHAIITNVNLISIILDKISLSQDDINKLFRRAISSSRWLLSYLRKKFPDTKLPHNAFLIACENRSETIYDLAQLYPQDHKAGFKLLAHGYVDTEKYLEFVYQLGGISQECLDDTLEDTLKYSEKISRCLVNLCAKYNNEQLIDYVKNDEYIRIDKIKNVINIFAPCIDIINKCFMIACSRYNIELAVFLISTGANIYDAELYKHGILAISQ